MINSVDPDLGLHCLLKFVCQVSTLSNVFGESSFTTLWANSADHKLMIYFLLPPKIDFDI